MVFVSKKTKNKKKKKDSNCNSGNGSIISSSGTTKSTSLIGGTIISTSTASKMVTSSPTKTPNSVVIEIPADLEMSSGVSKKKQSTNNNLVKDELADLEAMRDEENGGVSRYDKFFQDMSTSFVENLHYNTNILRDKPRIIIISLCWFVAICTVGLSLSFFFVSFRNREDKSAALDLAEDTGRWFSDQLDRAILPLFSLAQFIGEIESFKSLAGKIAESPHVPSTNPDGSITHRQIDGICDDETMLNRFNGIAKSIKNNAGMEGVLVALQMVPHEVVCTAYPLINTEDFEEGIQMDNRGAIGLDLLSIPSRIAYAESVLAADEIYIAGPWTLRECETSGECNVAVEKAFIAALSVSVNNHTIEVVKNSNGNNDNRELQEANNNINSYQKWGSVEAIINWNALIHRSDIFERFLNHEKGFQLTRADTIIDPKTKQESSEVIVLAETDDYHDPKYVRVNVKLHTVNDMWEMTIAYEENAQKLLPYCIAGTILVSFFFASLLFVNMLQKQSFKLMQKRYLEDLAQPQKLRLRMFLDAQQDTVEPSSEMENQILKKKPIADFFPNCTIMKADIASFSSWSSEREPSQVFKLLQTVFYHFDKITKKRGVFKVQTKGDAYIAVSGIPEPEPDHYLIITKLAQECLCKFNALTRELEKQLGPETADLKMRIGISSGPVIGGVLLGVHSRFHIFGSTVNTAVCMEGMSKPDRIHLSEKTALLLIKAGKKKWLQPRKEKTFLTGEGETQTYFLNKRKGASSRSKSRSNKRNTNEAGSPNCSDFSYRTGDISDDDDNSSALLSIPSMSGNDGLDGEFGIGGELEHKDQRLIDWQVESLSQLLKKIVLYRNQGKGIKKVRINDHFSLELEKGETVLDEVQNIIMLPDHDSNKSTLLSSDLDSFEIGSLVMDQLRTFVQQIAEIYHDNPFHNFEHASHVTMAVHKLLNRIVTPEEVNYERKNAKKIARDLHDYTFGITSDPLTHFAVVFSALIHDCDHIGVSNPQLSKENPALGEKYKFKSVAEQNSVDLAWDVFMQPRFEDLQKCIFANREEYVRFRQLIANTVLATDIFDPELKALRNMRWDQAFHSEEYNNSKDSESISFGSSTSLSGSSVPNNSNNNNLSSFFSADTSFATATGGSSTVAGSLSLSLSLSSSKRKEVFQRKQKQKSATNLKATIVIEHIIQASDVAHTMQHWKVYIKWNEKLFQEMYLAYKMGRSAKDPSLGWYNGELWFFDNYVIPLAKKLDECGVFGVASDECLFHALENRRSWASGGEEVVQGMLKRVQGQDNNNTNSNSSNPSTLGLDPVFEEDIEDTTHGGEDIWFECSDKYLREHNKRASF